MAFSDTEMKELGTRPKLIFTSKDRRSVPSSMSRTSFKNHFKHHLQIVYQALNDQITIDDAEDVDLDVPI